MKNKIIFFLPVLIFVFGLSGCGLPDMGMGSAADGIKNVLTGDEPQAAETESISESKYAYSILDDGEKLIYDEILSAIMNREEVRLDTTDPAEMELAYQAIRYDYCDLFWLDQLSYVTYRRQDEVTGIDAVPTFTMTPEEQEETQKRIDAEADRMLENAPADGSDFDKTLYVYETLVNEIDYAEDSANSQNIISAFIDHSTICQGYAYATQYLLERLGVNCTTVTGTAQGEKHAWNLVFMDGAYYYIDTTWGNSQYIYRNESEEGLATSKYLDYDYFGVTTEALLMTHEPDSEIPLPDCVATEDNYYIHEGLYIEAWDVDRIGNILKNHYDNGEEIVHMRFADVELCEQAAQYFMEAGHLFDYCAGLENIQYLEDTDHAVIVFLF